MQSIARAVALVVLSLCAALPSAAQEPLPRIGPWVVDLRGMVPKFGDDPQLKASRPLATEEMLPGPGLGASGGVHVYLPKIFGVTVGIGGEAVIGRSRSEPPVPVVDPATGMPAVSTLRPVTETFKSISPQLSLNFGHGNGWSYLSAGIGRTIWSIIPDGANPTAADEEILNTLNYGGGARWFIKRHLAFSLDVRIYNISPGTPQEIQGSLRLVPRIVLLVIGAGISVR